MITKNLTTIVDCRGRAHRYLHISARITVIPPDDRLIRDPITGAVIGSLPPYIIEKGTTYNVGRNKRKAELRAIEVLNRRAKIARRMADAA